MPTESEIKAGQACYTSFTLKLYNFIVPIFNNHCVWRCPTRYQLEQYHRYVTPAHLDIGVGTGFFLKKTAWPHNTQLSLMDLNPACLQAAAQSVSWLSPAIYLSDIFKPQANLAQKFDSISMNYLLHCLPGDMRSKNSVIANATSMLRPGGILFGSTILPDPELQNFLSIRMMHYFNKKQIFSNQEDRCLLLKEILEKNLTDVDIKIIGCVALFKGIKKIIYP
ncbi:MAG: class I SAM-dependent methyltransferase [Chthoniobacterales bacterium]|nr:class I SAM-dependent methyltransferase [Chthoniobacterales bacterium]